MITAKNITKLYGDRVILEKTDFKIGNGRKIGLVGRNGCGKTTLFKIINGLEDPTAGNIEYENEMPGYIPQEFSFPNKLVGEYLEDLVPNKWENYKIETILSQLKFHNYDPYQDINTLSEGQKMKLKLAEALLNEPTALFIDEPTNHLDIQSREVIEDALIDYKGAILVISHDRYFLDKISIGRVITLQNGMTKEKVL